MEVWKNLYEVCFIQRVNKECHLPSLLAIGRGMYEVVDGNLRDGGATLACPEWCRGLSLKDTVHGFRLSHLNLHDLS